MHTNLFLKAKLFYNKGIYVRLSAMKNFTAKLISCSLAYYKILKF